MMISNLLPADNNIQTDKYICRLRRDILNHIMHPYKNENGSEADASEPM
jgi:hypothetical protein